MKSKKLSMTSWVSIALIVVGAVFVIESLNYNAMARTFPLIFGVLLVIFALVILLVELSPAVSRVMGPLVNEKGVFGAAGEKKEDDSGTKNDDKKKMNKDFALVPLTIWLVVFALGMLYFNYLIVIPIWTLLFVKFQARHSWKNAIVLAAGVGIFVYVIFGLILQPAF